METHSSILAWRIPMDRGAWWATVHGVTESDMTEQPTKQSTAQGGHSNTSPRILTATVLSLQCSCLGPCPSVTGAPENSCQFRPQASPTAQGVFQLNISKVVFHHLKQNMYLLKSGFKEIDL